MLSLSRPWLVLSFSIVLALSGHARAANYIAEGSLSPTLLLPPPAEGDDAWKSDMQAVEAAQQHISDADMAALRDEQHPRIELMARILGEGFTRVKLPKTFALLDKVAADTRVIVDVDKTYWHTRRPYLTDPQVKLLVDPISDSPGYPSGHTCFSRVMAEVLAMIYPERTADLRAAADAIAWHRVEAGVHSPSDLAGGRALAALVVGALTQSREFQADLAIARREHTGQ